MLGDSTARVIVMDLNLGDLAPKDAVLAVKRVSPEVLLILYSGYPICWTKPWRHSRPARCTRRCTSRSRGPSARVAQWYQLPPAPLTCRRR